MPKPDNSGPPATSTSLPASPVITRQPQKFLPATPEPRDLPQVPGTATDPSPATPQNSSASRSPSPELFSPDRTPSPILQVQQQQQQQQDPDQDEPPVDQQQQVGDNFIEMEGSLSPPSFSGDGTQNASLWWDSVTNYSTYRGLNDQQTVALFPLLLRETALGWFQTLPEGSRDTTEHLKPAFLDAFGQPEATRWSRERMLYSMQQTPSQTTLQFVTKVRTAADGLKLDDAHLLRLIIGGLRPSIRAFVLQQKPATIKELLTAATVAEQTAPPSDSTLAVDSLMTELQAIRQQMSAMMPQVREARSPSPSPRRPRVHFQDQGPQKTTYQPQPRYQQQPARPFSRPPSPAARRWPPQSQSQPQQTSGRRQPLGPDASQSTCYSCGKSHRRASCPNRHSICFFCHKEGHLQKVCRQAKRQSQH